MSFYNDLDVQVYQILCSVIISAYMGSKKHRPEISAKDHPPRVVGADTADTGPK